MLHFALLTLTQVRFQNDADMIGALLSNQKLNLKIFKAMNPILYSFLGYGFRNRLFNAIKRIKSIIPKRRLSTMAPSNVSRRRSQQRRRCSTIGVLDYL